VKIEFRLNTAAVIAVVLISAANAEGARSDPLDEDAALELLQRTLKRDRVYEKRISWDCISYRTEESTNAYFEFVLREIHNAKCGRDSRNESCHRPLPRLSTFRQNQTVGSG